MKSVFLEDDGIMVAKEPQELFCKYSKPKLQRLYILFTTLQLKETRTITFLILYRSIMCIEASLYNCQMLYICIPKLCSYKCIVFLCNKWSFRSEKEFVYFFLTHKKQHRRQKVVVLWGTDTYGAYLAHPAPLDLQGL